jgi:hypothetical protein
MKGGREGTMKGCKDEKKEGKRRKGKGREGKE